MARTSTGFTLIDRSMHSRTQELRIATVELIAVVDAIETEAIATVLKPLHLAHGDHDWRDHATAPHYHEGEEIHWEGH